MTNDFKPAKAGGNQPRLSKEEYAEKKRAEKEKIYQMIDDAAREIVSDPEKFKSFLDTQSRMDRYSAANALLIYSQYPQATQLKDFNDWGKDNVKITKGAKSVSILEPVEYTRADGSPGISYNVKRYLMLHRQMEEKLRRYQQTVTRKHLSRQCLMYLRWRLRQPMNFRIRIWQLSIIMKSRPCM